MLSSLRMLLANLRLATLAIHKTNCSIAEYSRYQWRNLDTS